MNKKHTILIALGCGLALAIGTIVFVNNPLSVFTTRAKDAEKTIRYHLADDASYGEKSLFGYRVTDPDNHYYYQGFVDQGTFTDNGLSLNNGHFFQADLKGAASVTIDFTSGSFAIELSSDNNFNGGHHSKKKYLASGGTYYFGTLFRFVRVLSCADNSVLTSVLLNCECAENYTFDTNSEMSESYWTNTVKDNKITLVSSRKNAIYDINYHEVYATKTSEGLNVFVKERVGGAYYNSSGSEWWKSDNFEILVNNSDSKSGNTQLYASLKDNNCGNFDVVVINTVNRTGYEWFNEIYYKCFISYASLTEKAGKAYTSSSDFYIWYGSRANDAKWDGCSYWEGNSQVKLTSNGFVDKTSGNKRATSYSRTGDWGNTSLWVKVSDDLTAGRAKLAMNCQGAQGTSPSSAWGDYCWRGPLAILPLSNNLGKRTVFRLDWWGWDDGTETGVFEPTNRKNGSAWAAEAARTTDDSTTQFYQTVKDCEMISVFEYDSSSNTYSVLRVMFPNDTSILDRKDYFTTQTVDCPQALGAYINAEWTNFTTYQA